MARILLIENDPGFAASLARVLGATGYETEVAGEGREGLVRASAWRPDGIVLCVELPDMSGYLVCQRLKKDEALRAIPLVLTSADATEKSFADHQKLKVRADAYLLKPFPPQTLLESLAHLVGVPERQTTDEEELVRLEDGADEVVPALDLDSLADEAPQGAAPHPGEAKPAAQGRDEDDLFLDSLMGLADEHPAGGAPQEDHAGEAGDESLSGSGLELDLDSELGDRGERDQPVGAEDLDAAADSLPDVGLDPMAELEGLREGAPAGELSLDDEHTPADALPLERPTVEQKLRPASADLLRAAGIKLLDEDDDGGLDPTPAPLHASLPMPGSTRTMPALNLPRSSPPPARSAEATQPSQPLAALPMPGGLAERLERELAEVREHLSDARAEILSRESEVRQLKDKLAAATRRAEQAEAEVRQARTDAGELDEVRAQLAAAERRAEDAAGARAASEKRAAEAEKAAHDAEAELERRAAADREAEQQLAAMRAELSAARGELAEAKAHPAAAEATAALQARVTELEAATAKHEDRVVKAYQKIRNDEKVRDKVRKALSIASQLLDEGMVPDPTAERRAAASAATTPAPRPIPGPGQG